MIALFKYWKLIAGGTAVLVFFILIWTVWRSGYKHAENRITIQKNKAVIEAFEHRGKKEDEITRLPVSDLKRRYCHWMRDSMQECLQADIPLRERQNDRKHNGTNRHPQ